MFSANLFNPRQSKPNLRGGSHRAYSVASGGTIHFKCDAAGQQFVWLTASSQPEALTLLHSCNPLPPFSEGKWRTQTCSSRQHVFAVRSTAALQAAAKNNGRYFFLGNPFLFTYSEVSFIFFKKYYCWVVTVVPAVLLYAYFGVAYPREHGTACMYAFFSLLLGPTCRHTLFFSSSGWGRHCLFRFHGFSVYRR